MSVPDFLNKKLLEWQFKENKRKTLDEFASYLGVKRSLLSMWMNGARHPGPEYRKRLIEMFGDEAAEALNEDPDLHAIIENWEFLTPEQRKDYRLSIEQNASKNDTKRPHKSRRTASP